MLRQIYFETEDTKLIIHNDVIESVFVIELYTKPKMHMIDEEVSKALNMNIEDYRQTLVNNYKALKDDFCQTYFTNEEDCKNACEWVVSLITINKLAGVVNGR